MGKAKKAKAKYYVYTVVGITTGGKKRIKDYPARNEAGARRRWREDFPKGRITEVAKTGGRVLFLPRGYYLAARE